MNKQNWIVLVVALGLMGGAAALLTRLQAGQKLGQPAVRTLPIPGSNRLQVVLPERVLNCTSEAVEPEKGVPGLAAAGHQFWSKALPLARWI